MGIEETLYMALRNNVLKILIPKFKWLQTYYEMAGFKRPFRIYMSNLVIILSLTYVISAIEISILYFNMGLPAIIAIALTLITSIIPASIVLLILIYYPVYTAKARGDKIDATAPFIAAYMGILASAGNTPEEVIARYAEVSEVFGGDVEFKRVIKRVFYGGMDLGNALREGAKTCPSRLLSEIFEGFASVSETGGDTRSFFRYIVDSIARSRQARLKDILNTLSVLAEMYVALVVVAPLVFTILLMIMASLGEVGISPYLVIRIINLVVVPSLAAGIVILIDSLISRV